MRIRLARLKIKNLRTSILLVALIIISYGCVAYTPPPPIPYRDVPQGLINTRGVKIAAEDGSFLLKYGEAFTPPISSNLIWWDTNPPKSDSFNLCSAMMGSSCAKVKVTVPGKKKPLYGYLNFSKMHPTATGPGSRSYLIEIPQRYIDEASGGRVSVVYEWVKATKYTTPSATRSRKMSLFGAMAVKPAPVRTTRSNKQTGWVLWLSDAPF